MKRDLTRTKVTLGGGEPAVRPHDNPSGWPSPTELEALVERFLARTLPASEWTHEAHLVVSTWYVRTLGPERALAELRANISALNESHGNKNTDHDGYHETITAAYVLVIAAFVRAHEGKDVASCARELLASPEAARGWLLRYYSPERLAGVAARRQFIEPDLQPLPVAER
jgi:hypothetical protein